MTEEEFLAFAQQVEADLIAHDPSWSEYPFGTTEGLLEQYGQTFEGVGTIFYYYVFTNPVTEESTRMTALLDMSRDDIPDGGDGIPPIPDPVPPEASDIVWYGSDAPEAPALSPIWFDTDTGDIRIWYSYNGVESWVNTGVAGVGKIEFLDDLQDVDVSTTAPVADDFLKYNDGDSIWYPYDLNSHLDLTYATIDHSHTLGDGTDVVLTSPIDTEVLAFDGTNWINKVVSGTAIHYGSSPPVEPTAFPLWFDTTTEITSIYYDDTVTQEWIAIGGGGGVWSGTTAPVNVTKYVFWFDTNTLVFSYYYHDGTTGQWISLNQAT